MKNNLLFILKIPPPLTGATFINKLVFDSLLFTNSFNIKKLGVSYSKSINKLGKFNINKPIKFIDIFFKTLFACCNIKTKTVYFQPSISGITYIRDLLIILLCKFFRKKIILHLHGKGIATIAEKSRLYSFLYKLGLNNSFLIVLSESQKKDIDFTNPKKIYVLNNGIPLLNQGESKVKTSSTINFLYLSNLLRSKGILDLLDACKLLNQNALDFKLEIIGSEGDISSEELNSIINSYNLINKVKFHGPKYGNDKIEYFEKSDVFVFPTKNEAFGLVLLEAMQFGLPIIATDEGAIPEIVEHGNSGFIFPKGETIQLYNYMKYCIENKDIIKSIGDRGKIIFEEKFSFQKFETNLLTIFNNVIQYNN